ncbi:tyrosine-type recombinase/integrase [Lichenihabitans sp. PAMC28606]|uniref:tyrosine-type recombinase/integrase n=1 Tax=Lichenihabitans sp. PAMC28606 TaxID=2880932 RepID=UPI001D0ABAE7|nr:tyrosine-type recombinase/integrase [Lichenihabitans sp. PAMC28606]UDL96232.1 tyrosine-type recombinase/integrase [Lichenihabitans sp. PAMC28606]
MAVAKKPVFVRVAPGISLGYRRNETAGTWVVRVADGKSGAWTKRIGIADDHDESDGHTILTFWEAQILAKATARGNEACTTNRAPMTIEAAARTYLSSLEARNRRTAYDARRRLERLFLPHFGANKVEDLTRRQLEAWRDGLVNVGHDAEKHRRSQDTANRVLSIIKALLNHAISDPSSGLKDDSAWRLVRPFQRVARAREVHFSVEEVVRMLQICDDPSFRDLLIAGFLTGARYGELAACQVRHFDLIGESLHIPSGKTGSRTVILQPSAVTFFQRISSNKPKEAPLLARSDGTQWGASHQVRPMKRVLLAAGLDQTGTFYALRHSYISRAIEAGVPLTVAAENCGTSVRMIETTYAKVLASRRRDFIAVGAPHLADTVAFTNPSQETE